jgi:hypothetical protein
MWHRCRDGPAQVGWSGSLDLFSLPLTLAALDLGNRGRVHNRAS